MITVPIPGGTADLYEQHELTQRRLRPIENLGIRVSGVIDRIKKATAGDDGTPGKLNMESVTEAAGSADITETEAANLSAMQDAIIWAHLKGWTLDRPLPAKPDDVLDLPSDVYRALSVAATSVSKAQELFEPTDETLADTDSPTGASAGSDEH